MYVAGYGLWCDACHGSFKVVPKPSRRHGGTAAGGVTLPAGRTPGPDRTWEAED